MKVRKRAPVRMAEMMMIHGIVPYCDSSPVIWLFISIRIGCSIHGIEGLTDDAARLPVIRKEWHSILCREHIVRYAKILHTKLCLNEIHETKGKVLCLFVCFHPFFTRHVYRIDIIVISIDWPVDHIPSLRGLSICDHHIRRPYRLPRLRLIRAHRITGRIIEQGWIIFLRLINSHVGIRAVILEKCHICKVLDHIVRLGRSNGFPRLLRCLHSDPVIHSACFCDVSQFGSIDQDICLDLESPA